MNDLTMYGERCPETPRKWRAVALAAGLFVFAGAVITLAQSGDDQTIIVPAWNGSIRVNCAGQVTVTSDPPGAVFVGTVTGVGTATVTASGYLDWPDNDETPAVSASKGNCTPTTTPAPTTTTTEVPPSSSLPPISTTSLPPSTPSTTPDSTIPTNTTTPDTLPTTSTTSPPDTAPPATVPMPPMPEPTTPPRPPSTPPRPQTTQPEPFCVANPGTEGCTPEGLPTAEGG